MTLAINRAPQGRGAERPKQEGQSLYLIDTCIAIRACDYAQASRIADEIAEEIRDWKRTVLCHVALIERDDSDDES